MLFLLCSELEGDKLYVPHLGWKTQQTCLSLWSCHLSLFPVFSRQVSPEKAKWHDRRSAGNVSSMFCVNASNVPALRWGMTSWYDD